MLAHTRNRMCSRDINQQNSNLYCIITYLKNNLIRHRYIKFYNKSFYNLNVYFLLEIKIIQYSSLTCNPTIKILKGGKFPFKGKLLNN